MNTGFVQTTVTLEDRLFKNAIYVGLIVFVIILVYDVFITEDYHSVIIECLGLVYFLFNLRLLLRKSSSARHRLVFTAVLFIIVNAAWLTGGGISLLMTAILFLAIEFMLVVNDAKNYRVLVIALIVNYIILFCIEYFFQFNLASDYKVNKGDLIKQFIIVFLLLFFGGYFTVFLKVNYNKERSGLNQANKMLENKSEEVLSQNEELKTSKEALDKTISKLDSQKKELIEIKNSLEDKVRERTNDLLSLNERLLFQNQQLEQYAFITSHNLRAPIAQIKGLVHLLPRDTSFNEVTNETLNRLVDSAEHIEKVFSDLSTILNVKNSIQKPWEDVDLLVEVEKVVESLNAVVEEKKIKIVIPTKRSFIIKALPVYVYSIIHNLVENAVKYSDNKKINSIVKIDFSETNKYHKVSIHDNGIGIDMEIASGKVFQMYQRFNNTHPGQGFGLFLVKSQMEAMSGKVELQSILGQGSTFDLYFPKSN